MECLMRKTQKKAWIKYSDTKPLKVNYIWKDASEQESDMAVVVLWCGPYLSFMMMNSALPHQSQSTGDRPPSPHELRSRMLLQQSNHPNSWSDWLQKDIPEILEGSSQSLDSSSTGILLNGCFWTNFNSILGSGVAPFHIGEQSSVHASTALGLDVPQLSFVRLFRFAQKSYLLLHEHIYFDWQVNWIK